MKHLSKIMATSSISMLLLLQGCDWCSCQKQKCQNNENTPQTTEKTSTPHTTQSTQHLATTQTITPPVEPKINTQPAPKLPTPMPAEPINIPKMPTPNPVIPFEPKEPMPMPTPMPVEPNAKISTPMPIEPEAKIPAPAPIGPKI